MNGLVQALNESLAAIPVVDAHEHLHPEEKRVARRVDVFLLFHQYIAAQLIAAGMPAAHVQALEKEDVPLDEKWSYLAPYLDFVRDNAAARPAFEALRFYFTEEDLTADNYERVSQKMQAHNQPGLYEKCLRQDCGIVLVLNQNRTLWQTELFKPILFETRFIGGPDADGYRAVMVEAAAPDRWRLCEDARAGLEQAPPLPQTLEGFIETMEGLLERRQAEGLIGVKSIAWAHESIDKNVARNAYQHLRAGRPSQADLEALTSYLRDRLWEACGRLGLVAVLHTGVWAGNYADPETIRPRHVLPLALAHPHTRFDLYHAGTPWPQEAGMIARATHNVWLNLCWSHLISPTLYAQALDLWLDFVPQNRIIAFGGDYWWNVENVYGALRQAQEAMAQMLAQRIASGSLTEARALYLARRWLHDNPRELYAV